MTPMLLFDGLLIGALLLVSWRLLGASDLFQAMVLFISFGLFLALAWIRLQAPDIALAEAAVGAGLAGVLLLGTLKKIEPDPSVQKTGAAPEPCRLDPISPCPGRGHLVFSLVTVAGLMGLLILAVLDLPGSGDGLTHVVARFLGKSGVEHPVTAVLLNFRLYDTWLELGVLLLAVLNVLCVRSCADLRGLAPSGTFNPVLLRVSRGLAPMMVLAVVYLLWLGDHAPGGAFQAGVVLAAMLVLFWLSGQSALSRMPRTGWLLCLVAGFGLMLLLAMISALRPGSAPLEYPERWAGLLILVMECAATLSIGIILASLAVISLAGDDAIQEPES